jgi:hypothetical protein
MDINRGQSFVGRISDHSRRKGWLFGAFADEPLLQSDAVEIAWQHTGDDTEVMVIRAPSMPDDKVTL